MGQAKLEWKYDTEEGKVTTLGADLFSEPDNWIFREDAEDPAETLEFAEKQLADHIWKKGRIKATVLIHDNGAYGHRTEITPKRYEDLDRLYSWCEENITQSVYMDNVIYPCNEYVCDNCFKEVDEPDTREEILEAGYVLNDHYDLVLLAHATPEERGAHIAKTADPEAMSKKYLLDAIKEPA